MSFLEALKECKFAAKHENRAIYLYENEKGELFYAGPMIFKKWLFKAYPGGQTILSVEGAKFMKSKAPQN